MAEIETRLVLRGILQLIDLVIGDRLAKTNSKPPEPAIYFGRPPDAPYNGKYPYVVIHTVAPSVISKWGLSSYIDKEDCVNTTEANRYSLYRIQIYDNKDQFTSHDILKSLHNTVAGLRSVRRLFKEMSGATIEDIGHIEDRTFKQLQGWVYSYSIDVSLVDTEIIKDTFDNSRIKKLFLDLDLMRHDEDPDPLKIIIEEPQEN